MSAEPRIHGIDSAPPSSDGQVSDDVARRVERFLYLESRLLDDRDYQEWLRLWDDPCLYWVPAGHEGTDPSRHVSIAYDDREALERRVTRLLGGQAYAQEPPSMVSRIVGNVEVHDIDPGVVGVRANFNLTEFRLGVVDTFAGRSTYRLHASNGSFLIREKTVLLVNRGGVIDNLTFVV